MKWADEGYEHDQDCDLTKLEHTQAKPYKRSAKSKVGLPSIDLHTTHKTETGAVGWLVGWLVGPFVCLVGWLVWSLAYETLMGWTQKSPMMPRFREPTGHS